MADPKFRGSRYAHALFIAAVLSAKQEALDLLLDPALPRSTRYRIQAQVRKYADLRRGSKLKIV